jgi:hypothetical protein
MRTNVIAMAMLASVAASVGAQQPTAATLTDCSAVSGSMDHAQMDHAAHAAAVEKCASSVIPVSSGQAAYGAISEIVKILQTDPKTDWAKVDIEALRQHLIDMDDVTMRSVVAQRNVDGGFEATVTGTGRTIAAIQRMTKNHLAMLDAGPDYRAAAAEIPNGVRVTVTARNRGDDTAVARVRGLGFAGILVEGDHHAAHHLAIARGESMHEK